MSNIKSVYNLIISFQMLCLVLFLFNLIENNLSEYIDISLVFGDFDYTISILINPTTILLSLVGFVSAIVLSSVTVMGSGLNTEGVSTIKLFLVFLFKYTILLLPLLWILSESVIFADYTILISLITLIFHFLYFMNELKNDGSE